MASPELLKAYQATFGNNHWSTNGSEHSNEQEILGVRQIHIPDVESIRYFTHGIANINIPMSGFTGPAIIMDLAALVKTKDPFALWYRQSPKTLRIHITDGSADIPKNALLLENDKTLQGLYVKTRQLSRSAHPAPYQAEVTPLYLEKTTQ